MMNINIKEIQAEVRRRQKACLAEGVSYVILDNKQGAYVEMQPDGREKILSWCGDFRGNIIAKAGRACRKAFIHVEGFGELSRHYDVTNKD